MWARDVCKPVAARAVSVSLGRPSVRPPTIASLSQSHTHTSTAAVVSLAPSTVYRARAARPVSLSVVAAVRHLRSHSDSLEPPPPRAVPTVSFAVCAIPSDQSDRSCSRVRSRVGCRFRRRRRRYYLRYFFFFYDYFSIGRLLRLSSSCVGSLNLTPVFALVCRLCVVIYPHVVRLAMCREL